MKKIALLIVATVGLTAQTAAAAPRETDGINVFERDAHIWVADARLHNERELVPGSDPAWSASAARIAFTFGGGIFTIQPDGAGATQLTHAGTNSAAPAWSPDGRWIAFSSDFGDYPRSQGIYVVRAVKGSKVRRVTRLSQEGAYDTRPSYTPDGRKIVFTRTRDDHGRCVSATIVTNLRGDRVRRIAPWTACAG